MHLRCARQAAALLPVASQSAEELAAERAVTAAALESAAAAEAARRQAAQAAAQAAAAEMAAAEAAAEALPCELHEAAAAGDAAEVTKLNGRPMQACAHHGVVIHRYALDGHALVLISCLMLFSISSSTDVSL